MDSFGLFKVYNRRHFNSHRDILAISPFCFPLICLPFTDSLCSIPLTGGRQGTQWGYIALCVSMATCAMLCKEQGITVMALCGLYEIVIVQKVSDHMSMQDK